MTPPPASVETRSLRQVVHDFASRGLGEDHRHLTSEEISALSVAAVNGVDKKDLLVAIGIVQRCPTCSLIYANARSANHLPPDDVRGIDSDDC